MEYGNLKLDQVEVLLNKVDGYVGVKALLSDKAWIMYDNPKVNLDRDPKLPIHNNGEHFGRIRSNQKQGVQTIDLSKLRLHSFKAGEAKTIGEAIKKLKTLGLKGYNAVFADFLLGNEHLFYNKRNEKLIQEILYSTLIFPGTTYWGRKRTSSACVRSIYVAETEFSFKERIHNFSNTVYETDLFVVYDDSVKV